MSLSIGVRYMSNRSLNDQTVKQGSKRMWIWYFIIPVIILIVTVVYYAWKEPSVAGNHFIAASNYNFQASDDYLVYFYSDTCEPCKTFNRTVEQYQEHTSALPVYKVNTDKESSQTIESLHVHGTPTVLRIQHGEETWRLEGNMPLAAFDTLH